MKKDTAMLDLTPDQFRQLGYKAVDLIAQQLENVHDAPTRRPVPDELRDQLMTQPLPQNGTDPERLLEAVAEQILPYPMGNNSPRFFAWVNSPAAPLAILGELLAAGMNPSVAGGDHAATYVEHGVLNWLKAMMGYPAEAGGILTSGGSVANLVALGVMRHVKSFGRVREHGAGGIVPEVIYTSAQGHSCIQKAIETLGFGNQWLRRIPVDGDFRMDMAALRQQITEDKAQGYQPICIAASAGTVNTGAVDPLDEIANLCAEEKLWFHVDGAYGGFGILAEQTAGLYKGIERADSLAIDPHKWLYVPVECGCTLVRDKQAMRDAFSLIPPYLRDDTALPWFSEFGIQQTRGFKALKLWLTIQQIGVEGYRKLITHDIAMARYLQARIQERRDFELVAAGSLSVTCFRYAPEGVEDVDTLNKQLLPIIQREGRAFLTSTELNGRLALRACIVNFRTTEADIDLLLEVIAEAGQRVLMKV
jgi:glutamate/tyrosine decarboxylase-like PLP-dependent enzyme